MRRRLLIGCMAFLASAGTAHAAFPGSNGRIAFQRELSGSMSPAQIFSVNPDGGGILPVTDGTNDSVLPRWSPDGKRIAYVAPDPSDANLSRIWVANADGSAPHEVAPAAQMTDYYPTWSPDGQRLAFERTQFDGMTFTHVGIVVANADGTGSAAVVPGTESGDDYEPAWSPDGGRLAVSHYIGGNNPYDIEVINLDGSGRHPLDTPPDMREDDAPAWSPDGATVWFSRGRPSPGCFSQSQIYAVPANGSAPAALVSKDSSLSDYGPVPSPDGAKVAFVRCDDNTNHLHHIWMMNADGSGATPVTSGSGFDDYAPDWQPAAPQFFSAPSISGSATNNQTLTATAGSSPGGGSTTLQFERCDSKGANCVPIPGAIASRRAHAAASTATYKLSSVDLGHAIRVHQVQTNSLGTATADSAPTTSVAPSAGHCSNVFAGTAKADRISGSPGSDRISGGRGRDKLFGLAGADCISGGAGNDVISGGKGNDTLSGGAGNDRITAGPGKNKVSGGTGNDVINVRNHKRDVVNCGPGKDRVVADRVDKLRGCEHVIRRR